MASPTVDFKKQVEALSKALKKLGELSKPNVTTLKNLAQQFERSRHKQENLIAVTKNLSKAMGVDAKKAVEAYTKQLEKNRTAAERQADALRKQKQELDILAWKKSTKAIQEQRKAQEKAAIATKKHSDKIGIIGNKLKEAGADSKTFLIVNRGLIKSSKGNAVAMDLLNRKVSKAISLQRKYGERLKEANVQAMLGVRNTRNLGGSFSVFRSKLLLTAFAINLYSRSIGNLLKVYGSQQLAELKVASTLKSTGMAAGITLNEIKKLTQELQKNGVVGDEVNLQMSSLMLTYDQIGKDAFPRALKAANDMATSLSMNIPSSEELKSSVTMLSKALQDPVRGMTALRKVGFSLSAVQVEQVKAFIKINDTLSAQNIILSAAEKQYGKMAKTIRDSTIGELNALSMAFSDAQENMGKVLADALTPLIKQFTRLSEAMSPERADAYLTVITSLASAMGAYVVATRAAVLWQTRLGWAALATAAGILATELMIAKGWFDESSDSADDFSGSIDKVTGAIFRMQKQELIIQLERQKQLLAELSAPVKELVGQYDSLDAAQSGITFTMNEHGDVSSAVSTGFADNSQAMGELKDQILSINPDFFSQREALKSLINEMISSLGVLGEYKGSLQSLETTQSKLTGIYKKSKHAQLENVNALIKEFKQLPDNVKATEEYKVALKSLTEEKNKLLGIDKLMGEIQSEAFNLMTQMADAEIAKQNEVMQNDINNVKESSAYKRAQKRGDNDMMAKLEKDAANKTLSARRDAMKQKKHTANASILISAAQGVVKAYGDYDPITATIVSGLIAAVAGLQMAQVNAQPLPKYARGGVVGGRRHSQGGTMIEAEQGEFIMSRSAVQSVGMENLNRMNEGGGGGSSVTVNVSGNVLSQDFVEGELAENIKEAIRRGTDFGIS